LGHPDLLSLTHFRTAIYRQRKAPSRSSTSIISAHLGQTGKDAQQTVIVQAAKAS
jgi:hypothetical protein